jgi:enamine deaminase RidA (YjgF/YER057c/UK114 family)
VKVVGDLAWVAGQIPMQDGAVTVAGKVGGEVTIDDANAGARRCALQALAALQAALGTLDRVKGIVKLDVFVASATGFTDHPKVANGASDLLVEVFGDEGRHARAAVGVPELPLGAAVEVALLVQVVG